MTPPGPAEKPTFIDPHGEPVRVIDQATFHGLRGSLIDVTLCTVTARATGGDRFVDEAHVAARLRFDIGMAKALVQGLAQQIALAEAAKSTLN